VNHSGLAVKFVRSNITKNPLIRLGPVDNHLDAIRVAARFQLAV
jgi:hypothetical protein